MHERFNDVVVLFGNVADLGKRFNGRPQAHVARFDLLVHHGYQIEQFRFGPVFSNI